jgi:hypothetical protein
MKQLPLSGDVVSTLAEGRQAHIAMQTSTGPHVTPELYAWSNDRLWFASASSTLKAKVLRRRCHASTLITVASRNVILSGNIEVIDPREPLTMLRRVRKLPAVARALVHYTTRNAPDLAGFAADTATGKLGWRVPPVRLLFGLSPICAAYVENDAVVGCWGEWTCPESGEDATIPAGGVSAVAAFPGPVAVPARFFIEQQVLHVPRGLLELLRLNDTFEVSVVVDEYTAPGPAAKRGTLIRGRGRVATDDPGFVEIDAERIVDWDGLHTTAHDRQVHVSGRPR